jgi:hypothetical protein
MNLSEADQWFSTVVSHSKSTRDHWITSVFPDPGTPYWVFRITYGKKKPKAVFRLVRSDEVSVDTICDVATKLTNDLRCPAHLKASDCQVPLLD